MPVELCQELPPRFPSACALAPASPDQLSLCGLAARRDLLFLPSPLGQV